LKVFVARSGGRWTYGAVERHRVPGVGSVGVGGWRTTSGGGGKVAEKQMESTSVRLEVGSGRVCECVSV
jgi:hypothetical protein